MSLLINIYVAIVQASLRLSFCCLEISVIAYTSWNGYFSFSVSFKVVILMKGQFFWQQMAKMCLKKNRRGERTRRKQKNSSACKKMCIVQKALRLYTYSFRPVIMFLREYPQARICSAVLATSAVPSTCMYSSTKTRGEGTNTPEPALVPEFLMNANKW